MEDMEEANRPDEERENKELRQVLAENAKATFKRLSIIGVQFLGPTPESPFEKPCRHNVLPNSAAYISSLQRECTKRQPASTTPMPSTPNAIPAMAVQSTAEASASTLSRLIPCELAL